MTAERTTDLYVEALTEPTFKERTTDVYIEVLVLVPVTEGWTVGYLPLG